MAITTATSSGSPNVSAAISTVPTWSRWSTGAFEVGEALMEFG
jgi:hypothetical protein